MSPAPAISGRAVSLAPFAVADVSDAYIGWLNDPEVVRHTEIRGAQDTASVAAYVEAQNRAAGALFWRILDAEGRHVGNMRLSGLDTPHRRAVMALIIGDRRSRGRGLGSAAIDLAAEHGFKRIGLHKIAAGIRGDNHASIGAFRKAGFHQEACFKEHFWLGDRYVDGFQFARFDSDPGLEG